MEIVQITGDVLEVVDEMRDLPVKDKDGNPTEVMKLHRFTTIKLLVQNQTGMTVCLCKGFDLPAIFKCPDVGTKKWVCPFITGLKNRKNSVPEVNFTVE